MSNGQIRPRTALDYLERLEIGTSLSVYLLQSIEGSTNKNQRRCQNQEPEMAPLKYPKCSLSKNSPQEAGPRVEGGKVIGAPRKGAGVGQLRASEDG
jgi:hypothetical protein